MFKYDDVYIKKYGYGYFINCYKLMKTAWKKYVEKSIFDQLIVDSGFFDVNKIQYREIHSSNGHILTKLVNLIYLLDYSSIYLAVLSKTDPTPVKPIEFIKDRI